MRDQRMRSAGIIKGGRKMQNLRMPTHNGGTEEEHSIEFKGGAKQSRDRSRLHNRELDQKYDAMRKEDTEGEVS